jgi:hypothetical protein
MNRSIRCAKGSKHSNPVAGLVSAALLALAALSATGCCGKLSSNKASWAAEDRGYAIVDVNRRLPNGNLDNGLVRTGPGFNYGKVTSLTSGTSVTVIGNQKTSVGWWSHIRFNGNQEGWMHQDILLKSREISSGSSISATGSYINRSDGVTCQLNDSGSSVAGTCSTGITLACTKSGVVLNCSWSGRTNGGLARLVQVADHSLIGSWGHGRSESGGGSWTLNPNLGGFDDRVGRGVGRVGARGARAPHPPPPHHTKTPPQPPDCSPAQPHTAGERPVPGTAVGSLRMAPVNLLRR